jgi:nicotinamidase-related amidase
MSSLNLDPKTAALILIDLQNAVVGRPTAPYSAADVVARSAQLATRFRELKSTVVLVNVAFRSDFKDFLDVPVDAPSPFDPASLPSNWSEIVPELNAQPGDLRITKRQWGAFYGTDLDLQLRRRGVRTIVLGGIATNIGVESTARDAYERNYHQIFVEDAMAGLSAEAHDFPVKNIFPRIGNLRSTKEVLAALG